MTIIINLFSVFITLSACYFVASKFVLTKNFSYLSTRKNRLGAIDGLKGYLALSVFICHFIVT